MVDLTSFKWWEKDQSAKKTKQSNNEQTEQSIKPIEKKAVFTDEPKIADYKKVNIEYQNVFE